MTKGYLTSGCLAHIGTTLKIRNFRSTRSREISAKFRRQLPARTGRAGRLAAPETDGTAPA